MGTGQRSGSVGQGGDFTTTEGIPRISNASRTQLGTLATRRATAGGRVALDMLAKVGGDIEVPDNSAFAADHARAVGQDQGDLVPGSGEATGQVAATNQEAAVREEPHVDAATVEKDLEGPTQQNHVVVLGEVPPARQDPVRPGTPQALSILAGAQRLEPQRIDAQQIVVEGHD